jgi:hypothetical protein
MWGKNAKNINAFHKLIAFLLFFFFIFAPRLDLNVVLHTGFISVIFLVMLVSFGQRKLPLFPRPLVPVVAFFLFLAIYHVILATFYDNNASYFFSICISVIISVVFGWLLASYLIKCGTDVGDLLDHILVMCTLIAILNSTVILIEFAFPEIKSNIERYLLQNSEGLIYAEHPFQLRGLTSAGGAGLSVFNAMAILFIIYLVSIKKISSSFALLGAVIISYSNVFTGRTGLIISLILIIALLMVLLIKNFNNGFLGVMSAISVAIFSLYLMNVSTNFDLDSEVAGWAFEWVDGLIDGNFETKSSDDLKTMLFLPESPIHLLFGVGFFEGNGKIYPRTDSGYLKTILSIGVPLSILMYLTIILLFFKLCKVSSKYLWLVVSSLGIMLIIEVKEPFLYQNFTARVILLLSGAAMFILAKRRALAKMININFNHLDLRGS